MPKRRPVSTIREQVYQILRDEICRGDYPPGTRLQELELAEHLNVSRSPVREVLRQLVSEGLLIEIPNKGVYVREFSLKDIDEIYELRLLLESHCICHSEGHLSADRLEKFLAILDELETSYEKGNLEAYTAADEKLHVQIVRLADNNLINETYERVRSMNQQFRVLSLMSSRRLSESLDEHRMIIHALATGDLKQADTVNQYHLELARNTVLDRLRQESARETAE
jgi:DNA-binding GntR family transcriptional regulator